MNTIFFQYLKTRIKERLAKTIIYIYLHKTEIKFFIALTLNTIIITTLIFPYIEALNITVSYNKQPVSSEYNIGVSLVISAIISVVVTTTGSCVYMDFQDYKKKVNKK